MTRKNSQKKEGVASSAPSTGHSTLERRLDWFKNHPLWSLLVLVGIIVIAIGSVSGALSSIIELGSKLVPSDPASPPRHALRTRFSPLTTLPANSSR